MATGAWHLHRLAAMPPAELVMRAWRALRARAIRRSIEDEAMRAPLAHVLADAEAVIGLLPADAASAPITGDYLAELTRRADDSGRHVIQLFGRGADLGAEINWFRDYLHDAEFPRIPAWSITYRAQSGAADIMPVWWLNRHQHLMPAAIAYFGTGTASYARAVLSQIQSWLEHCPYPLGPAWSTGIEAGIRLMTWSWLYRFLFAGGRPEASTDAIILAWFHSVCRHVRFIETHWSRYSSANNHIIAEAAGVMAAAVTWPVLFKGRHLVGKCHRILVRECHRQIADTGEHLEQSTSYHAFVLELLLNACVLHEPTRKALAPRLKAMAQYLHALACNADAAPEFGDADGAVATGILERGPRYYHELVAAACAIASEDDAEPAKTVTSPVFWYAGRNLHETPVPPSDDFSGSSSVVWNGVCPPQTSAKLCVDVGPLGLGSLAAHGHADALSFTLHVNGESVLIDPGTYAYHGEPAWRSYFRGTRAHNTLCVGGRDQAVMRGPFLWGRKYAVAVTHCIMSDDQFDLEASHDGYMATARVRHRRRISWHPLKGKWVIEDELVGSGEHAVELLFHVHPRRRVDQVRGSSCTIEGTGYALTLKMPAGLEARIACGENEPPLGWWSPVLGVKEPCSTVVASGRVRAGTRLVTELCVLR